MDYRKIENTYIVRLDPGDEITEQMRILAKKENIKLAQVNGLGAVNAFTVGAYSLADQTFYSQDYEGVWEIASLVGNINTMNGEFYLHLHMSAGDNQGHFVGGHMSRAVISATGEVFVTELPGTVDREKDPSTGINIFKF